MYRSTVILLVLSIIIVDSSCQHMSAQSEIEHRIEAVEERINQLERHVYRYDGDSNCINDVANSRISFIRCKAITKKGTRCKRIIKSGSYCWQHQRYISVEQD